MATGPAPASIVVYCKRCGKRLSAPPSAVGRQGKCGQCGSPILIPAESESLPPVIFDNSAAPGTPPARLPPPLPAADDIPVGTALPSGPLPRIPAADALRGYRNLLFYAGIAAGALVVVLILIFVGHKLFGGKKHTYSGKHPPPVHASTRPPPAKATPKPTIKATKKPPVKATPKAATQKPKATVKSAAQRLSFSVKPFAWVSTMGMDDAAPDKRLFFFRSTNPKESQDLEFWEVHQAPIPRDALFCSAMTFQGGAPMGWLQAEMAFELSRFRGMTGDGTWFFPLVDGPVFRIECSPDSITTAEYFQPPSADWSKITRIDFAKHPKVRFGVIRDASVTRGDDGLPTTSAASQPPAQPTLPLVTKTPPKPSVKATPTPPPSSPQQKAGETGIVTVPCIVNANLGSLIPKSVEEKVRLEGDIISCPVKLLNIETIGGSCRVSEGKENLGLGYRFVPDTKTARPGHKFVSAWIECDVPAHARCVDLGDLRLTSENFQSETAFGVGTELQVAEGIDFTYLPFGTGVIQEDKGLHIVYAMHFGAGRLASLDRDLPAKCKFRLAFEVSESAAELKLSTAAPRVPPPKATPKPSPQATVKAGPPSPTARPTPKPSARPTLNPTAGSAPASSATTDRLPFREGRRRQAPAPSATEKPPAKTTPKPLAHPEPTRQAQATPRPSLPPLPGRGREWPERCRKQIERAITHYSTDPVAAYLTFRDFHENEHFAKEMSTDQKLWLQGATERMRDYALAMLDHELAAARTAQDIRRAFLALATRCEIEQKIDLDLLRDSGLPESMATLETRIAGGLEPLPVWEVRQAEGTWIGSHYSEVWDEGSIGIGGARYTLSLDAPAGHTFLRVKANVKNVGLASDPSYAPWPVTSLIGLSGPYASSDWHDQPTKQFAFYQMCLLLMPDATNKISMPGYVSQKCRLWGGGESFLGLLAFKNFDDVAGEALSKCAGFWIKRGEEFDLDVIYVVPADAKGENLRLMLLGSDPVPITLSGTRPAPAPPEATPAASPAAAPPAPSGTASDKLRGILNP